MYFLQNYLDLLNASGCLFSLCVHSFESESRDAQGSNWKSNYTAHVGKFILRGLTYYQIDLSALKASPSTQYGVVLLYFASEAEALHSSI